ncbi:cyclic nucleotide-binding domain-containing protein [Methyloceanibacter sp.]|uniref:cyclic nucleotide-binding domain-containing protein n=1 Tax=Methyloceanibacter sp. TaxID=1965321 RepID=UPI003C727CB5
MRSVFIGLDDAQIARLLAAGAFCDLADGTTLAVEDERLEKIYFICAGRVGVTIAGREVSHLERGNFVGEVAFLTEKPATATVIAGRSSSKGPSSISSSATKRKSRA